MGDPRSDDELLAAAARRDGDAFGAFYARHLARVVGYLFAQTRDAELTADLTAEVFAAALLACRRYRPGDAPASAWLHGIARNKLRESRRAGRVQDRARRRLGLEPLALDDDALARVEELASVGGVLADVEALPAAEREAVLARVVDERPYDEIARGLECSEQVVRQRVSRGLARLRARIGEDGR